MESYKHKDKEVVFWSVTGEVLSQNKFSETDVYSRSRGTLQGGGEYVTSKVTTKHDVWIKKEDGSEENLNLDNKEISLREGQKVTLVYAGYKKDKGYPCLLINHNSKVYGILNDGESLDEYLHIESRSLIPILVFIAKPFLLIFLISALVSILGLEAGEDRYAVLAVLAVMFFYALKVPYNLIKVSFRFRKMKKTLNSHLNYLGQKILQKT